jgi:hypothetical protein
MLVTTGVGSAAADAAAGADIATARHTDNSTRRDGTRVISSSS